MTAQTADLKQKLEEYEKNQTEFLQLKRELQVGYMGTYTLLEKTKRAKELKDSIDVMMWRRFSIYDVVNTNEKLIKKYKAIAEGTSHKGAYNVLKVSYYPKEGTVLKVTA